jgi:DNA-binding response OmpR family regulator
MSLQVILLLSTEPHSQALLELTTFLEQDGLVAVVQLQNKALLPETLTQLMPDLILIDLEAWDEADMHHVQQLCAVLDTVELEAYRPVVVVMSHGENEHHRIDYLVAGADDILDGKLSKEELRIRLLAHLRRNLDLRSNASTQLPSLPVLARILQRQLNQKQPWALLRVQVQHFEAYRNTYGKAPAHAALLQIASLLSSVLVPPDWVGHGDEADFLLLTQPEKAEKLARILCRRFDLLAPSFYSETDRQRKHMIAVEGSLARRLPLMHLAIGVTHSQVEAAQQVQCVFSQAEQLVAMVSPVFSNSPKSRWLSERRRLGEGLNPTPSTPICPDVLLTSGATVPCNKPRILIVESDAALAYLLQMTLEMQGCEAEAVASVEAAKAAFPQFKPWLVLLDAVINNETTGWALCQTIKQACSQCQVMVLSSLHERDKAMAAGADIYCPKPFDLLPVLGCIRKTIESQKNSGAYTRLWETVCS